MVSLANILKDSAPEPAFVALALVPPGEADDARDIGRDVDPDAIFRARSALRAAIGERLAPQLSTLYGRLYTAGGYSPDARSAGRRALRNVALDLMAATGNSAEIPRAHTHYTT